MCPEICRGKSYSWGSDIWAMGCVLYEMCALRVPFNGHDLKSLVGAITKSPIPDLPPQYSKGLQGVLSKLLCRNPSTRLRADHILGLPLVYATANKIEMSRTPSVGSDAAQRPQSAVANDERPQSAAGSEAQQPSSNAGSGASSGQYSDTAGTYSRKDKVEYYSATHHEWLPASITDVDSNNQILMDVKPNTWISLEVQSEKVRPRKRIAPPESKEDKGPSGVGAPLQRRRSVGARLDKRDPQSARLVSARRNSAAARLGA